VECRLMQARRENQWRGGGSMGARNGTLQIGRKNPEGGDKGVAIGEHGDQTNQKVGCKTAGRTNVLCNRDGLIR